MVWALRTVFMMIPDSAWEPGGRVDPRPPFYAFRQSALCLTSPFTIVRSARPAGPRRRRTRVA